MSQFLEGDIRLSQRFAALNKQGLDLQQDQIDFNRKMLKINTAINGVQAAVSLTSAAVGLGKAIYDRKAMQAQNAQRANIDYIGSSMLDAVNAGYVPYEDITGDNGETLMGDNGRPMQRYVGFDDYTTRDGRTIGQVKEEIKQAYGKGGGFFNTNYFGNMAFQELETGLKENELRAQKALMQREYELNVQIRNDDMNNLVNRYALGEQHFDESGNEIPIETVIRNELNRHPMSPEEREVEARKWTEKVHYERTLHDAKNKVTQEGFDAAVRDIDAMMESGLIDDGARKKIIAEIAHEDDILKRATDDQIQKQIEANKTANDGKPLSICAEKDQMAQRAKESGNPREQRQWEEAASRNQETRLDERFHDDYVTAQSRGLPEAKRQREKYVKGGRYQADYDGQSGTQDRHLRQWDSLIDEMEREERATRERSSGDREINGTRIAEGHYEEWAARMPGCEDGHYQNIKIMDTDAPLSKKLELIHRIQAADRSMGDEDAKTFDALAAYYKDNYSDKNGKLTAEGERKFNNALKSLQTSSSRGATPKENKALLEGLIDAETIKLFDEWKPTRKPKTDDLNKMFKMANDGIFDKFRYETFNSWGQVWTDEIEGTSGAFDMMISQGTPRVNETLKATGIEIKGSGYNLSRKNADGTDNGDTMEIPVWNLSNGETVRVKEIVSGGFGKPEKAVLEVKDGNTWKPFDETTTRTKALGEYEVNLPVEIKDKIAAAFSYANILGRSRGSGPSDVIYGLKTELEKALGSEASTEQGKAYIDILVDRYRKGRPGL